MATNTEEAGRGGRILNFDYLTFYVSNAKQAASFYVTRFGFEPLAHRAVDSTANKTTKTVAHAVKLKKIIFVFVSPYDPEPNDISNELSVHGDFVKDTAFTVENLDLLVYYAKASGADVVRDIYEEEDQDGVVRFATLKTYGDNTHTLVDRSNYRGPFLPGFSTTDSDVLNQILPETHFQFIDHVEANLADDTLENNTIWYEKNLRFHRFWCVDHDSDWSPYNSLRFLSVANEAETVILTLNETVGGPLALPVSKVRDFMTRHGGPGVEHVALHTADIVATVKSLKSRGAELIEWPASYYDILADKLKSSSVKVEEDLDVLKELRILVDYDDKGYMLQTFAKHSQDRPTFFIELIQRRNHKGFGYGNYKRLFDALEADQEMKIDV